jgi:ketoreductase
MSQLAGRAAVITGGTTGIGLAVTELVAESGAPVLACGIEQDEAARVAERLQAEDRRVETMVAVAAVAADMDGLAAAPWRRPTVRRAERERSACSLSFGCRAP